MEERYLAHHGILGQKWGVRRYQNSDGTLTPAGKKRYGDYSTDKQIQNRLNDVDSAILRNKRYRGDADNLRSGLMRKKNKLKEVGQDLNENQKGNLKTLEGKIKEYDKYIKQGERETKNLINKAKKAGYTVKSKPIYRSVADGRDAAAIALTTIATLPLAAMTGFAVISTGPRMEGTSYKVKRPRETVY